jgi:Tfp pilus assembly protein PilN
MSAIQFNLLPDVKMHYVKSQRSRNLVITLALLISGASLAVFLVLLFTVNVIQKKQLSDASGQVTSTANAIKAVPDINKVLTIQNQLISLTTLHKNKHVTSRLYTYLPQVTPTNVKISSILLDFSTNSMTISGTANSQHTVNTFIDTLKFTTYKVANVDSALPAFPSVIESSFSIAAGNSSYSITTTFDPQLFTGATVPAPKLTVPKLTTTRSVTEDPSNPLFNTKPKGD